MGEEKRKEEKGDWVREKNRGYRQPLYWSKNNGACRGRGSRMLGGAVSMIAVDVPCKSVEDEGPELSDRGDTVKKRGGGQKKLGGGGSSGYGVRWGKAGSTVTRGLNTTIRGKGDTTRGSFEKGRAWEKHSGTFPLGGSQKRRRGGVKGGTRLEGGRDRGNRWDLQTMGLKLRTGSFRESNFWRS